MKILVEIDTEGNAFQGVLHWETVRLLRVASSYIQSAAHPGIRVGWKRKLLDSNGNSAGFIKAVHHSEV